MKEEITNITVRQILDLYRISNIDVDIYDDYDERCGLAYCGTKLTEAGEKRYEKALNLKVSHLVRESSDLIAVVVHCENGKEATALQNLLSDMAGYCSEKDYDKYFADED